ncbi:flavin reductase family protein [Bacteroidota bacterium]
MQIDPKSAKTTTLQGILAASVAPRPIALASTIDPAGNPNLSPFSFYNSFGINPPILVFSPSRRGRDNTTKHTFDNIKQHAEVVINVVNYNMVHQINLASTDYKKGVNEFAKAGLTPVASEKVKPFRVKESPVSFECKVLNVIETGTEGGAGNLVICEILLIHVNEDILSQNDTIDQEKIDLVGRLGGSYYIRTTHDALFEIPKPGEMPGIGVDSLPDHVRFSKILTGNELGQLGMLPKIPLKEELDQVSNWIEIRDIMNISDKQIRLEKLHHLASFLIKRNKIDDALKVLLVGHH